MTLPENLNIRSMIESDLDAVMALELGTNSAPHWKREQYLVAIEGDSGSALRRIALVLEAGSEVAGFAVGRLLTIADGGEAELESIVVAPRWRRVGLGASLLAELVVRVRAQGARRLDLEVRASNVAAIQLYVRAGLRETGRRPEYYHGPEEAAVLMSVIL